MSDGVRVAVAWQNMLRVLHQVLNLGASSLMGMHVCVQRIILFGIRGYCITKSKNSYVNNSRDT